ncbi:hypothetical protein ACHAWT_005724 [Skeletonema menzelii]
MTNPREKKEKKKHVVVVVLGDIGRSPRMQYHTLSLLEHGHFVTLIGYVGERLIPALEKPPSDDGAPSHTENEHSSAFSEAAEKKYHKNLRVLRMKPHMPPKRNNIMGRLLYYPLRLTSLLYCLFYTLWKELQDKTIISSPVDVVLVQNPPSVPTLLLVYLYCVWEGSWRRKRPRFVIDWHNLGYTMFESPTQQSSFLRTIILNSIQIVAKSYERILAPMADAHLTVTHAMEVWLGEHFNVHGTNVRVLYDKPPLLFRPTTIDEEHELFQRLDLEGENEQMRGWLDHHNDDDVHGDQSSKETLFTQCTIRKNERIIQRRQNRPALLISSTSWTPDEDFSVLLDALERLHTLIMNESKSTPTTSFPNILVVVTGKGPQKEYFLPLLHKFNEEHQRIKIITLWLEASDYPKLLGCATLGVCLHTSTSGLDLPMKVLDMFGCQVPVCAIGFDCLDELVKDGVNGRVFCDGVELSRQLFNLLKGYPSEVVELERYRQNIRGMTRWRENWDECARHLIVGDWE